MLFDIKISLRCNNTKLDYVHIPIYLLELIKPLPYIALHIFNCKPFNKYVFIQNTIL